ncbi:MAG: hypothetical protein MZV65_00560 [Chromatiales bacterium]|nr:hypothetical protein [Chromatiales bacterium]
MPPVGGVSNLEETDHGHTAVEAYHQSNLYKRHQIPISRSTGDTLALALVLFLFLCLALEFHRPFYRPGLANLKHSYLTNICTFLFNDITLSLLSIPTLYFIAQQFAGLGLLSSMPDGPFKYLLTFVLLDLALYAWHYATHQIDVASDFPQSAP